VREIPATWMRGGTSKCWVFEHDALRVPGRTVDDVLLRLYGSPDPRQVDGVGGGTSTTSKAVLLAPGTGDADVDYTFAQIATEESRVDWGSNCGNCSSVVAPYAVRRGWVRPRAGTTRVRVRNTNTGQLIVQEVPTPGGGLPDDGTALIPGVPFPGLPVRLWFADPAGATTGALFPSGGPLDHLDGPDGPVAATLVDAGAPVVVLPAGAVGLTGHERPAEIDARSGLLAALDRTRRQAAVLMGLSPTPAAAERAVPKLALVAPPTAGQAVDLEVRMLSMGRVHPALAITGSIALSVAAREPGTVVAAARGGAAPRPNGTESVLHFATPAGIVETRSRTRDGVDEVGVLRTARRLADARLPLPEPAQIDVTEDVRHDHEEVVRG
jgi:2-methylaconitate cis-trans-isomerase PrpF